MVRAHRCAHVSTPAQKAVNALTWPTPGSGRVTIHLHIGHAKNSWGRSSQAWGWAVPLMNGRPAVSGPTGPPVLGKH